MSTAGKVLTVLSALLLVVWTIMISAVAQINENGAKRLAAVKQSVAKHEEDIAKADSDTLDYRAKTNAEQAQKERDLRVAQAKLADVEAQLTTAQEALIRIQLQLEKYTQAANSAKADLMARNQELTDLQKSKADHEAQVTRLQGENSELLNQLEKLRGDFQETLRKNTAAVQKELKASGNAVKTAANGG